MSPHDDTKGSFSKRTKELVCALTEISSVITKGDVYERRYAPGSRQSGPPKNRPRRIRRYPKAMDCPLPCRRSTRYSRSDGNADRRLCLYGCQPRYLLARKKRVQPVSISNCLPRSPISISICNISSLGRKGFSKKLTFVPLTRNNGWTCHPLMASVLNSTSQFCFPGTANSSYLRASEYISIFRVSVKFQHG